MYAQSELGATWLPIPMGSLELEVRRGKSDLDAATLNRSEDDYRLRQRPRQSFDVRPNLVPDPAVDVEGVFVGLGVACELRRIVEGSVDDFGVSGKDRAVFVRVAADGDHNIEIDVGEFAQTFGVVFGNIDTGFEHDAFGDAVEAVLFDARGIGLKNAGLQMTCPALRHLAAAGIPRAQEEDASYVVVGCHNVLSENYSSRLAYMNACPSPR